MLLYIFTIVHISKIHSPLPFLDVQPSFINTNTNGPRGVLIKTKQGQTNVRIWSTDFPPTVSSLLNLAHPSFCLDCESLGQELVSHQL